MLCKAEDILFLDRSQFCLHVVDSQEKLMAHIYEANKILDVMAQMVDCAKILEIPAVASTQYVKGLGVYPAELENKSSWIKRIDKIEFNCLASRETAGYYDAVLKNVRVAVLIGVETHICITQTACGLLKRNILPWIVVDGVSSRKREDHKAGLKYLRDLGCAVGPAETIIYKWLGKAGTPEFKSVLPLITGR